MMTDDLTKTFFKTFGIKPKYTYLVTDMFYTDYSHTYGATKNDLIDYFEGKSCGRYKVIKVYKTCPTITDRILLELICIANEHENYSATTNMKNIKERTLRILLKTKKYLKDTYSHKGCHNGFVRKVRKLFEECKQ